VTTATKPLSDHGTPARGNGVHGGRLPCRCQPCALAVRAARKRRKVYRQLGKPALIDATPARNRLILLHHTMCWRTLAAAAKGDPRNLQLIYRGDRPQITRTTHNKIMAVPLPATADATLYVDATGTRRRIQALQAGGHSYQAIADAVGSTRWRVNVIADGKQPTVRQHMAQRIADAYDLLARQAPAANGFTVRSRNNAAAKGWLAADFWDDVERIDDPDFDPSAVAGEAPKYMRLGEDALWLRDLGFTRHQIADRLGESVDYMDQIIRRYVTATSPTSADNERAAA
jgi:hypothetical protein